MGKARMIQLSTDDVFDGSGQTPYTEFDTPNPQTVYGKSKLAGENFVKEFCNRHIIVRSSWIFGEEAAAIFQKILKLAGEGRRSMRLLIRPLRRPGIGAGRRSSN